MRRRTHRERVEQEPELRTLLLVRYGGDTVLTEVIDNELVSAGRQFELTPELARLVGLDGTQEVEWRYATRQ